MIPYVWQGRSKVMETVASYSSVKLLLIVYPTLRTVSGTKTISSIEKILRYGVLHFNIRIDIIIIGFKSLVIPTKESNTNLLQLCRIRQ